MNREEIKEWLDRYGVENYTINDDLTVDVDSDIWLFNNSINEIPFKFGVVNGCFDCSFNELTSLKGCPQKVNCYFNCNNNKLISLAGCPEIIYGNLYCLGNKLTSLENSSNILGDIYIDLDNEIEGFEAYLNETGMCYIIPVSAIKAYYLHKRLSQIVPEVTKTTKKVKL